MADGPTKDDKKSLDEYLKSQEKNLDLLQKINVAANANKSALEVGMEFRAKEVELIRNQNIAMIQLVDQLEKHAEDSVEDLKLRADLTAQIEKEIEAKEKLFAKNKILSEQDQEELKLLKEQKAALKKDLKSIKEEIKDREEDADALAKINAQKQAAKDLGAELGSVAAGILGIDKNWNQAGLSGKMLNVLHTGGDMSTVFGQMKDNIMETVNPANLLGTGITKMVQKTKELTMELGTAFGQFKEATGGGEEYLGVLSNTTAEMRGLDISTDLAVGAVEELYKELAMFSSMSEKSQKELSKTVATLEAFDVAASSAVDAADILMQSVGYTGDEFIAFEQSLKSMSKAIDVPMSTLHSQFTDGADIIGKYGKQGVEEFKKLATAAKATGIEMNSLLSIAEQFDTFESAAEQVGQLNAILGGAYFDTVQMVNATEEERIDLLRRGVQATGKSFDQLGRYEKKAIAAAAGISDINEANKLFGTSTAAYGELQQLASDASMSLSDLSEEAFNTLGPMRKFDAVMNKLQKPMDIMLKLLDFIATILFTVVDTMEDFWKNTVGAGEAGVGFSITITAMMAVLFKFGGVMKFIGGLLGKLGSKFVDLFKKKGPEATEAIKDMADDMVPASEDIAKSITNVGAAATKSALGIFAMGAAIALVGVGVYAILSGVAELVSSFKDLDGWQIAGALGAIALSMTLIIIGIKFLIPLIAALGAVSTASSLPIAAVGAAIALIGFGIKMAVDSMAGAITAMASLFTSFGSLTLDGAAAMAAFATEIGKFGGIEINQELTTFTKHLGTLMMESAKVTPESAKAVKTIFQETATLAAVEANDNVALIEAISNLVAASSAPAAAAGGSGGTGRQSLEVNVMIDGKKTWSALKPYAAKDI
jgi:hypothetical protein